ncbi:MAG: ABC transporter ATP-binding protein [Piscinibacter sp.]
MSAATGAAVRLEGIAKSYGQVVAVRPLDLEIERGTLVTLLGPSGCGKTTLLRMIAGLEQATSGRLFIGGRDVTLASAGERNVSMVFQSYALFPHMSVADNVAYGLVSSGLARRAARAKAEAALETVGLAGFGERLPSQLSGGQQQRVAVARALVLEPDVLLFDEPLSNLDARLRRSMREEIRALQQRLGLTVVYVTHDQSEALAVSDRIVVMRNAAIAQVGTPESSIPARRASSSRPSWARPNPVKGVIEASAGGRARVRLGEAALDLADPGLAAGEADVVIRPEAIVIGDAGAGGLAGRIAKATYMGSHTEYVVETALGQLFAISPDRLARRTVGDAVSLAFDPAGVMLVAP